jgi:hypothetical protein
MSMPEEPAPPALAPPAPPAPGASAPAPQTPKPKPRKNKPRKKPFRLLKFDKFLLEVVRRGESDSESLRARYNLDPLQYETRLRELSARGYIIPDAANPRVLRLGIEGFNAFPPRLPGEARRTETASPRKPEPSAESKPQVPAAGDAPAPEAKAVPKSAAPLPAPETPAHEPDLAELLSKGRPNPNYTKTFLTISAVGRKWLEGEGQRKPVEETLILDVSKATRPKEKHGDPKGDGKAAEEKCELCRSAFNLSVGKEGHPKYGHCFCGAPYHKDCYDSLLEGSGTQCVRCGKRLSLILDKVSEEAVKELKKLFD